MPISSAAIPSQRVKRKFINITLGGQLSDQPVAEMVPISSATCLHWQASPQKARLFCHRPLPVALAEIHSGHVHGDAAPPGDDAAIGPAMGRRCAIVAVQLSP